MEILKTIGMSIGLMVFAITIAIIGSITVDMIQIYFQFSNIEMVRGLGAFLFLLIFSVVIYIRKENM